jgi:hypothetical protein
MEFWIPLLIAAGLSIASYFSEHLLRFARKWHDGLLSLSAGILIAMLLYKLLPLLPGNPLLATVSPLIVLLGFVGFYLGEEWVYQHGPKRKMAAEITGWHAVGFSIDHAAIVGFTLVLLADLTQPIALAVITIPFLIHVIASADSLGHITRGIKAGPVLEALLSMMPLIGASLAFLLLPHPIALWAAFAYILGALLFLTVRDAIPSERESRPLWFVIGVVLTVAALAVL